MRTTFAITTAGLALALCSPAVSADPWNERTVLTFDQAVMIPGAVLPPATYVFQLGDANGARHTVRVSREDDREVVATVQAVPMRRFEATNDIVLRFAPTEAGVAPALKGWYYPGRLYGHEFIYPEEQARHIAERTRTLVLSADPAAMSDMSGRGTLHVLDGTGKQTTWRIDDDLNREWEAWNRSRHQAGQTAASDGPASAASGSQAAIVQTQPEGMKVRLDELEKEPSRYIGKRVTVDGEVDDIIGPRLFKIDEPGWIDLDGELIVALPRGASAALRENDRVTVSGTVRQFVRADVDRDWGWLDSTPETELRLARKPVIVADRVVGGDDTRTLLIRTAAPSTPVGTSGAVAGETAGVGASAQPTVNDAVALVASDDDMVGRRVALDRVAVSGVDAGHGFFIGPRERQLFVLTQYLDDAGHQAPGTGQRVSIEGIVMQMPGAALPTLHAPGALNRHIYVYATRVH